MSWIEKIGQILFSIPDIEIPSYDKNVTKISFSILKILWSCLMFIEVNIDYKENTTIIKKGKTINVSVIKNILF